MSMASSAKKVKLSPAADPTVSGESDNDDLPECPYGAGCYRKNPQHFKDFAHPSKDGTDTSKTSPSQCKKDNGADQSSIPPCKYGANCYRKNLIHFAEFSHPTHSSKGKSKAAGGTGSGSDTDICDSDDDTDKKKCTGVKKVDSLLLVKSYSKMTEDERKELIKKAMVAKQQLQEELKKTKEKMAEKDKELKNLQDQVTTGLLLVEGEKAALEGTDIKYFTLQAERAYREGSADQIHFRLAESQFYRLLSGQYSTQYRVTKVEYVVNPELVRNFNQAREDLKKEKGEKLSYPVLAFHGTNQSVIPKICQGGFLVPGEKGFNHKTDTGWYGKGVYFSEYPAYSMSYIHGGTKLLLCQVLPGKVYQCTALIHGASLKSGFDSHTSPDKKELVVFNSHHILPSYIVHYQQATTEFKYSKTITSKTILFSEDELLEKYQKACKVAGKGAGVFSNKSFTFSGKMVASQKDLFDLICKHGGKMGSAKYFDVLISTPDDVSKATAKVQRAADLKVPIYSQGYIFDMIIKKGKIKDASEYEL